ncbi:MAG: hypothetical protein AW07_04568 [Candidatus Accumulibacter sp. SK-11]|nr:MAG: hypothetical protein AW07_04568 [Candidatus Accumulibacter sp. SK-11]
MKITEPGESSFTSSATRSRIGEMRTRISRAMTMSLQRLTIPLSPTKGVSRTTITGTRPTASMRAWIRSVTKTSGTK